MMEQPIDPGLRQAIVISAVNLNRGGTLRILRDCLAYLSTFNEGEQYRIIAVVYDKALCDFPHIDYIETKWPKKRWTNRLWFEYVTLRKLSKTLQPIALWLSLHDTTPSVFANRRAVYCHNSFPFLKWTFRDLLFAPNIVFFALFSRFFYHINMHRNNYVVVQQEWFRKAFVSLFDLKAQKIIVSPPKVESVAILSDHRGAINGRNFTFIYPAIADSHKNFECICHAAKQLWERGVRHFEVRLTIKGDENRYAKWLYKKWSSVPAIRFLGYQEREALARHFEEADSLIFPSRVETWGLPISEFSAFNRPMLLADLPYAHETAQGSEKVAFFAVEDPTQLAALMEQLLAGNDSALQPIPKNPVAAPTVQSWPALIDFLLNR